MKLAAFSISNFRSIKSTNRIAVGNQLIILGPNNEGKSNIVRALVTALRILEGVGGENSTPLRRRRATTSLRLRRQMSDYDYDWDRDCHVELKSANKPSKFCLWFELNDDDIRDFQKLVGSRLNGQLPIEIEIGDGDDPKFTVRKQGKAGPLYRKNSEKIANFIGSRLSINHIKAVRTAEEAMDAVSGLVSTITRRVRIDPEYQAALQIIQKIQDPFLKEIESKIQESLGEFLPNIKGVHLVAGNTVRSAVGSVDIYIDDGQKTPLENKGDGVISVVSMALLAGLSETSPSSFNTILAIEEPESHLHPTAIRGIGDVLSKISNDNQIIITTHSPILVNTKKISSNIIVEKILREPLKK